MASEKKAAARKITEGRFKRLHVPSISAPVRQWLDLPEGLVLYSDSITDSFVVLDSERHIVSERKWGLVSKWRKPGKTMSFVARHDLRSMRVFGRSAPNGEKEATS